MALEDLAFDRLVDVGDVVVAERLHAAGALAHAQRRGVRRELDARVRGVVADLQRGLPGGDLDAQVVPGLGRRTRASGPHGKGPVVRPEPVGARLQAHAPTLRHP